MSKFFSGPESPCSSSSVPARGPRKKKRKRKAATVLAASRKLLFDFDSESIVLPRGRGVSFDDPNFEIAPKNQETTAGSPRIGRSCCTAPVFQSCPFEFFSNVFNEVVRYYSECFVNCV